MNNPQEVLKSDIGRPETGREDPSLSKIPNTRAEINGAIGSITETPEFIEFWDLQLTQGEAIHPESVSNSHSLVFDDPNFQRRLKDPLSQKKKKSDAFQPSCIPKPDHTRKYEVYDNFYVDITMRVKCNATIDGKNRGESSSFRIPPPDTGKMTTVELERTDSSTGKVQKMKFYLTTIK